MTFRESVLRVTTRALLEHIPYMYVLHLRYSSQKLKFFTSHCLLLGYLLLYPVTLDT